MKDSFVKHQQVRTEHCTALRFNISSLVLAFEGQFCPNIQNHFPSLMPCFYLQTCFNFQDINLNLFFFFIRAQLVPTTLALRTTTYLSEETEYLPWQSAINNLHYYHQVLDRTQVYQPMQVIYTSEQFGPVN